VALGLLAFRTLRCNLGCLLGNSTDSGRVAHEMVLFVQSAITMGLLVGMPRLRPFAFC
jgi:hypothetical protein